MASSISAPMSHFWDPCSPFALLQPPSSTPLTIEGEEVPGLRWAGGNPKTAVTAFITHDRDLVVEIQ